MARRVTLPRGRVGIVLLMPIAGAALACFFVAWSACVCLDWVFDTFGGDV
jgi:hypothetical protein